MLADNDSADDDDGDVTEMKSHVQVKTIAWGRDSKRCPAGPVSQFVLPKSDCPTHLHECVCKAVCESVCVRLYDRNFSGSFALHADRRSLTRSNSNSSSNIDGSNNANLFLAYPVTEMNPAMGMLCL